METMWVIKRDRAIEGSSDIIFICKTEHTAKYLVEILKGAEQKARKFNKTQPVTIDKTSWPVSRGDSFEYDSYPVY